MTNSDIQFNRSHAIKFYGPEGYAQILRVAEEYMTNNKLPIPSDGIERMPSYWATIQELIREDSKSQSTV